MNTYYEILGLEPGASQVEIKKAYFKMIRQFSPESDPEQFQKIREAYEQLKSAKNESEKPVFPPFVNPFAATMMAQIEEYQRAGDQELYEKACEQAWKVCPGDIQFLYLLVIAQRQCGRTGKAVKNAELLVSKEPENKWFQRELAVSYIERGYTKKAFKACERAYELGCRDTDFILLYSMECDENRQFDRGIQLLREVVRQEKRWSKEEIPDLVEAYMGLLALNRKGSGEYFNEFIEGLCGVLEQYGIYMGDYVYELATLLPDVCVDVSYGMGEYQKAEHLFDLLRKVCREDSERDYVEHCRIEFHYRRIAQDPRIGDTLKNGYDAYYFKHYYDGVYDSGMGIRVEKFALTDIQLCMLEERTEILQQAEILKKDYPDYYEKIKDFVQKLESGENLSYIKDSLQKNYRRLEPEFCGGFYYEKYPEEERKVKGTRIYDGMEEEPYVRSSKKIGRNDPCPCGSGKKYKHCCMKNKR